MMVRTAVTHLAAEVLGTGRTVFPPRLEAEGAEGGGAVLTTAVVTGATSPAPPPPPPALPRLDPLLATVESGGVLAAAVGLVLMERLATSCCSCHHFCSEETGHLKY